MLTTFFRQMMNEVGRLKKRSIKNRLRKMMSNSCLRLVLVYCADFLLSVNVESADWPVTVGNLC